MNWLARFPFEVQETLQLINTSQGFVIEIRDVCSTCSKVVIQLVHSRQKHSSKLSSNDEWLNVWKYPEFRQIFSWNLREKNLLKLTIPWIWLFFGTNERWVACEIYLVLESFQFFWQQINVSSLSGFRKKIPLKFEVTWLMIYDLKCNLNSTLLTQNEWNIYHFVSALHVLRVHKVVPGQLLRQSAD